MLVISKKELQEAQKLGFKSAIIPTGNLKGIKQSDAIKVIAVDNVKDAITKLL